MSEPIPSAALLGPAAVALPVALAFYGLIRAVSWVIGGFAAS
jgi:hypothetical protein